MNELFFINKNPINVTIEKIKMKYVLFILNDFLKIINLTQFNNIYAITSMLTNEKPNTSDVCACIKTEPIENLRK